MRHSTLWLQIRNPIKKVLLLENIYFYLSVRSYYLKLLYLFIFSYQQFNSMCMSVYMSTYFLSLLDRASS